MARFFILEGGRFIAGHQLDFCGLSAHSYFILSKVKVISTVKAVDLVEMSLFEIVGILIEVFVLFVVEV